MINGDLVFTKRITLRNGVVLYRKDGGSFCFPADPTYWARKKTKVNQMKMVD